MKQLNQTEQHKSGIRTRLIILSCLIGALLVWVAATWADRSGHQATANIASIENPMELPYKYLAVGWVDWATVQVQEISEADPKAVEAHFVLGLAAESSGNYQAAQSAYRRITAISDLDASTRSAALSLLGRAMLHEGRIREAKPVLTEALELNEDSASALLMLGQVADGEGLVQQALDYYEKAMEQSPDWIDPVVRVATIYNQNRDHAGALALLLSMETIGSRYASYQHQLAMSYWGMQSKAHANTLDQADLDILLDGQIDVDHSIEILGELAHQALERALRLNPQDPQLLLLQSYMEGPAPTYP